MGSHVQIAPSILSADFANLERDVTMVANAGADWIHVDVMDGHFVPNLTIGPGHIKALKRITEVPLDVHLMIDNPETQLPWYVDAGADSITLHAEACERPRELLSDIRAAGIQAGISLNPETPLDAIASVLDIVDLVLVMSVHPGFGGQSFIPESIKRISAIAALADGLDNEPLIEVDGGINLRTAPLAVAAGADVLVAGNAIFGADDPVSQMGRMRDACS